MNNLGGYRTKTLSGNLIQSNKSLMNKTSYSNFYSPDNRNQPINFGLNPQLNSTSTKFLNSTSTSSGPLLRLNKSNNYSSNDYTSNSYYQTHKTPTQTQRFPYMYDSIISNNLSGISLNELLGREYTKNDLSKMSQDELINTIRSLQNIAVTSIKRQKEIKEENMRKTQSGYCYNEWNNEVNKSKGKSRLIEDTKEEEVNISDRFYCQFCAGKKFISEKYLEDHMKRRHIALYERYIKDKNYRKFQESNLEILNQKLNEMKNTFENLLLQNKAVNNYQILDAKVSGLENLIKSRQKLSQSLLNSKLVNETASRNSKDEINKKDTESEMTEEMEELISKEIEKVSQCILNDRKEYEKAGYCYWRL